MTPRPRTSGGTEVSGSCANRQPGMAEDSAGSTSSRKEFDQLADLGVHGTAAVPGDSLGARTTFETETEHEWSSEGSRATKDVLHQAREESVRPEDDHC